MDDENRLLFKFSRYEGRSYLLLLEVIHHHNCQDSRFLNGVVIDASKIIPVSCADIISEPEAANLSYVNAHSIQFHLLDKVISLTMTNNWCFSCLPRSSLSVLREVGKQP